MTIAAEIRAEAARQSIERGELARRAGMSRSSLYLKLAEKRALTLTDVQRLADALGVPMWRLVRAVDAGCAA